MKQSVFYMFIMLLWALCLQSSCSKNNNDDTNPLPDDTTVAASFIFGADMSYVNQVEDHGGKFTENGVQKDVFKIFADNGATTIRVRIWHNPAWIKTVYGSTTPVYSGLQDVIKTCQRSKAQGMDVLLDFHYSDIWADPQNQKIPDAWKNITSVQVLSDSVYNYTLQVLDALGKQNLLPEMVQIGNESNCGFMYTNAPSGFPKLNVCNGNWANFGQVVNAGIKAVRDMETKYHKNIEIALHVADPNNIDWWFSKVIDTGKVTDFDIIGFSYYPHWHKTVSFTQLPTLVTDLIARFNRKLIVLETAYPFSADNYDAYGNIMNNSSVIEGYPCSVSGQTEFLKALCQNMITAGASGVFYWEPAWISSDMKDLWGQGSAWENCCLFSFTGSTSAAIKYMSHKYNR